MSIYVARITKINQKLPAIQSENVLNLNCLHFFQNNVIHHNGLDIPLYQLTPYYLKDSEGHIMENIWQGSKVYQTVEPQYEVKAGKLIWQHVGENHVIDGNLQQAFWIWRKKLWENPYPVRYPNGYYGRHKCLCSLWFDGTKWETLDYISARKKIYCKIYAELVQNTDAYKILKNLYDKGQSLQICEMDVRPSLITEEILRQELNNPKESFGHGYVLAACLMGLTQIFDE